MPMIPRERTDHCASGPSMGTLENNHRGVMHRNGEQILEWHQRARTEIRNPPR